MKKIILLIPLFILFTEAFASHPLIIRSAEGHDSRNGYVMDRPAVYANFMDEAETKVYISNLIQNEFLKSMGNLQQGVSALPSQIHNDSEFQRQLENTIRKIVQEELARNK